MGRINCADEKKGFTDAENLVILEMIIEAKADLYVSEYQVSFSFNEAQKVNKDGEEVGASASVDGA